MGAGAGSGGGTPPPEPTTIYPASPPLRSPSPRHPDRTDATPLPAPSDDATESTIRHPRRPTATTAVMHNLRMSINWITLVKAASLVLAVLLHTLCTGCASTPGGSVSVSATDPHSGVSGTLTVTLPLDKPQPATTINSAP